MSAPRLPVLPCWKGSSFDGAAADDDGLTCDDTGGRETKTRALLMVSVAPPRRGYSQRVWTMAKMYCLTQVFFSPHLLYNLYNKKKESKTIFWCDNLCSVRRSALSPAIPQAVTLGSRPTPVLPHARSSPPPLPHERPADSSHLSRRTNPRAGCQARWRAECSSAVAAAAMAAHRVAAWIH